MISMNFENLEKSIIGLDLSHNVAVAIVEAKKKEES